MVGGRIRLAFLTCALLALFAIGAAEPKAPDAAPAADARPSQLVAPDGVPYDNAESFDVMQMKPLSDNLLANGSFEEGRYWPYGWEATDGLTTFWIGGGTQGHRCLRIYTDVLDAQWKARFDEVCAAVDAAARKAGGNPQALPTNPVPPAPERAPTEPPYYDTVAGLHGVHYRSAYINVTPGAIYRFSVDARTEAKGEPKVFVKGFFDQQMQTRDGVQTVRRDAYQAPMTLDPCDGQWRRYARLFHPSQSRSTLDKQPLRAEWLQVQIYAYWRPGNYYFDNARLEIVGMEDLPSAPAPKPEPKPEPRGPALPDDAFPIFNP
jgi:hypothetical protein